MPSLLAAYRQSEFAAAVERGAYLNHAGIAPMPARVARAVSSALEASQSDPLDFFVTTLLPAIESARARLARLMGVPAAHLALVKNTGHALSLVADSLILEPGDNIVSADCEYPSVVYPWNAQKWRGIETRLARTRPDGTIGLADIAAKMDDRTRVVTLSWVQFGTGFRTDLAALTQMAHAKNALVVADVIQGLGALPCKIEEWGVDIAATGSHKWLCAPSGTGGLYVAPHALERMRLLNMGAASVVNVEAFDPLTFTPKPTVQRYEEGSPNSLGIVGLDAALSLLEEVGMDAIAARILSLTAYGAELLDAKGYKVCSPRADDNRAGLLLFRHPRHANETLLQTLADAGVTAAVRGGKVRFSPHFYNTGAEMARAIDALPES